MASHIDYIASSVMIRFVVEVIDIEKQLRADDMIDRGWSTRLVCDFHTSTYHKLADVAKTGYTLKVA